MRMNLKSVNATINNLHEGRADTAGHQITVRLLRNWRGQLHVENKKKNLNKSKVKIACIIILFSKKIYFDRYSFCLLELIFKIEQSF